MKWTSLVNLIWRKDVNILISLCNSCIASNIGIPLESIMQIKRIKEITKNVQDVICVVLDYPKSLNLPSPLFQLSPQNTHIRRLISFDNEKILKTNNSGTLIIPPITSQSNEHAVEAIGFLPTVTEAEVWAHFSQFGQISKVDLESYNAPCGAAFDADCEEDDDDTKIIKRTGVHFHFNFTKKSNIFLLLEILPYSLCKQ